MALELKVVIAVKDQTKKFRFNQEMSISEVCAEIKEKTGVGGYALRPPWAGGGRGVAL